MTHGSYIGYKFKLGYQRLSNDKQEELKSWPYPMLYKLYENECKYTEYLYDEIGWTEDVKVFLRYNANKALMNLGLPPLFPDTADDVNPIVLNGLSTATNNHDFFSLVGTDTVYPLLRRCKSRITTTRGIGICLINYCYQWCIYSVMMFNVYTGILWYLQGYEGVAIFDGIIALVLLVLLIKYVKKSINKV
ncbi:ribonucleotide-diphosphate reductase subunit beta [Peribacillus sp. SCS-155]|uniref:ribonucleotide-diphosphate reductase subunit beta n=1 Tax=Peribacillus sedimenti TaxID=3115297 RepID=UPI003905BFC5